MWQVVTCLPAVYAQTQKEISALEKKLQENLPAQDRANVLAKLAIKLHEVDLPKAAKYAEEALKITEKYPKSTQRAESYYALALIDKLNERNEAGFEKLQKAQNIFSNLKDTSNVNKVLIEIGLFYSNKSQNTKADALLEIGRWYWEKQYPETYFHALALHYTGIHNLRKGKFKEAIANFEYANVIYAKLNEYSLVARLQNNIGLAYKNMGFMRLALEYYVKSLKSFEKTPYVHRGKIITLMNIANSYVYLNDSLNFQTAFRYYYEAKYLAEKQKNRIEVLHAFDGLGKLSVIEKRFRLAEVYFDSSLRVAQKYNLTRKYATTKFEKARMYFSMKSYGLSEQEVKEALHLFEQEQSLKNIMDCFVLLGNLSHAKEAYKQAIEYYSKAESTAKEIRLEDALAIIYNNLANIHLKLQNCQDVINYAEKIYASSIKRNLSTHLTISYQLFAEGYKCKGAYKEAITWLEKHQALKDSLDRYKKRQDTQEIQALYDYEKQQKVNELLKKDYLLQDYRLSQRTLWLVLLSILLGFAIILVNVLFYFYGFQQKKNKEIKATNQALEESNNFKAKLISIIAHDLRRPYANLMGTLQLVRSGDLDAEEQMYLFEEIEKQTAHTQDFINSLLFWAKTQINGFKYNPIEFDFSIVLISVKDFLEEQMKEKGIALWYEIPNQTYLYADMEMMKIILLNLCANAIKFSHLNSTVKITFTKKIKDYVITVEDEGLGISPENQQKINQGKSFYTSGTKGESGFGLGLMICFDLAERLKGKLLFQSELGRGTTFSLVLPLHYPQKNS